MPVFWSPTKLGMETPGGIFWRLVQHPYFRSSLHQLASTMLGLHRNQVTIADIGKPLSTAMTGVMLPSGLIADTLPKLATSLAVNQAQSGVIADVMKSPASSMNVAQIDSGAVSDTLYQLATAIVLTVLQGGPVTDVLPKMVTAMTSAQTQSGTIADTLPQLLSSAVVGQIDSAAVASVLPQLVTAALVVHFQGGPIADVLPAPMSTAMVVGEQPGGFIVDTFAPLSSAMSAAQAQPVTSVIDIIPQPSTAIQAAQAQGGAMGSSLGQMSSSAVGAQAQSGVIADAVPKILSALNAVEHPQGVIAASLQLAATAITGGQTQSGIMASLIPKAITALSSIQTQGGTIASALMQALTALVGQSVVSGVTPDATGAGGIDENTGSVYSFNSNAAAASTLFVFVNTADNFGHQPVNSVIYDPTGANVAMKLMTHVFPNNDSGKGDCYCYYLQNIVGSNKQVQVTLNAASWSVANSVSYNNVQNITLLSSAYSGTATGPSVPASPALAGDVVVNAYQGQNGPITPSGGTIRSNIATTTASSNAGLSIQDTTTSTTFSGTSGASFPTWASITINLSAVPSATPLISGVNTSSTTTVPIPAHVPGNLIVIVAFNNASNSPPGKPTASGPVPNWAYIDHLTGANSCSMTTASFVATASNHTSGTWTGMTNGVLVAIVLTGAGSTPIGGHAQSNYNVANKMTAPALTLTNTDGTSLILEIYAQVNPGSWNAAPAGYTRQAAYTNTGGTSMLCINTKNDSTSDGAIDQPDASGFGSNQPGCGTAIEIRKH